MNKKTGITRPRPNGGVTRNGQGHYTPPLFSLPLGVQNVLQLRKKQAQVVYIFEVSDLSYLSGVCYDNTNQDMTCLFFRQLPCFSVRDEERDEIFLS